MEKLIAIPMSRYKHLTKVADQKSGLKETIEASIKTLENQDLLQRQRRYKIEENAELPKSHNKVIHQEGVTAPSLTYTQLKKLQKQRNEWFEKMDDKSKKIKKSKAVVVKKPVVQKVTSLVPPIKRPQKAETVPFKRLRFV
uniref:Uncharacterized protein n=1 Tax=Panagrolaimus superbus TaxID=310955 RepID=A0A914YLT1_9BILA